MFRQSLKRLTFPMLAQEPVTVQDVALQARIDDSTGEDMLIGLYIQSARDRIETLSRRIFFTSNFVLTQDGFNNYSFDLTASPIVAFDHIQYLDLSNVSQLLSSTIYNVDLQSQPGRVTLGYSKIWPYTAINVPNTVQIYYSAGYGTKATDVPPHLRHAILLLAADYYERRQDTTELKLAPIPTGIRALCLQEHPGTYY